MKLHSFITLSRRVIINMEFKYRLLSSIDFNFVIWGSYTFFLYLQFYSRQRPKIVLKISALSICILFSPLPLSA